MDSGHAKATGPHRSQHSALEWLTPRPLQHQAVPRARLCHAMQGAAHGLRLSPCHPGLCFAPSQTRMPCGFSPHNARGDFRLSVSCPDFSDKPMPLVSLLLLNIQLCYLHIKLQVINPACQQFRRLASLRAPPGSRG